MSEDWSLNILTVSFPGLFKTIEVAKISNLFTVKVRCGPWIYLGLRNFWLLQSFTK